MFDNIRADLRAYGGHWGSQGFWAMVVYRYGRWAYAVRWAVPRKLCTVVYQVLFKLIQIVAGIELPCHVPVGRNFVIDHSGGIVVSGYAKFGDDCRIRTGVVIGLGRVDEPCAPTIGNNVVIGLGRVDEPCAPTIGNNVDIGAGAKVLGAITIGDNVLIGANAVVVRDVPSDSIAVGVPAVVKPRRPG